jgi:hypothetical protein
MMLNYALVKRIYAKKIDGTLALIDEQVIDQWYGDEDMFHNLVNAIDYLNKVVGDVENTYYHYDVKWSTSPFFEDVECD